MKRLLSVLAVLAAVTAAAPASAQGSRVTVALDHAERVGLRAPAGSVIVGNPAVADVTVVDERTLFVQGKAFGVTQIVVLDRLGRNLFQGEVVVTAPQSGQVTVFRGSTATDMACAGLCAAVARPSSGGSAPASAGAAR